MVRSRQLATSEGVGATWPRPCGTIHDGSAPRTANGNRKSVPYGTDLVDYFFIITPQSSFLIPVDVVADLHAITLDEKYAAFAV